MPSSLLGALPSVRPAACRPIRSPAEGQSRSDRTTPWSTPASAALAPKDLAEASGSDDLQCESREAEDVTTTMVVATIAAHIGRRSELGACRGMMFRRYLIRADEAWHDSPHQQGNHRPRLSRTASGRVARHAGSVRAPGRSAAHPSLARRAGVPDDIRRTPARAEVEASGGARSEAVPLLHRCTGSSDGLVHASERRRVQASDARPDEVQAPGPTAARRSHPPDTAGVTSA